MLTNLKNYGIYSELLDNGIMTVNTLDLNSMNIDNHFTWITNILNDGIETEQVQNMFIHVIFSDGVDVDLTIFDYAFNLTFWILILKTGEQIDSLKLVFFEDVTKKNIKKYIDQIYVKKYRTVLPFKELNNYIDDVFNAFHRFANYQMYLANTVNLEDTIELMNKYPEFNDTIHLDMTGIALEDVKEEGMKATRKQIEYIKNSDHCLRDSFRTGEAISPKQYKEVQANIGTKPDGRGSVYPYVINTSFINGGLNTIESSTIESSVGRVAQILQKTNVGTSGAFARLLGLNNIDTTLHHNPNYTCNTKNYQEVYIRDETMLRMYDMRYYKTQKKGLLMYLDADRDKHLIGQTLLFRSPMTCASFAAGKGICYKCYGDLAYVNREINIGKIAAELLSSIFTQILLSAKHLLESLVIKMNWSEGFADLFTVTFNTIQLKEDVSYNGFTMIINTDFDVEDDLDLDGLDYNESITSFIVRCPDGTEYDIHTSEADSIYIHPDLMEILNAYSSDTSDTIELDMQSLVDIPILFVIQIKNNELSRTMDRVKNIINNKNFTKKFDRNSILKNFVETNIEGNIIINSVHFEVLLANQIREKDDILLKPNWEVEDEECQLLTLNESLTNNQSIAIRLEYSKISKTLYNPSSFRIKKPSTLDLYFMSKPQNFIDNADIITDEKKDVSDGPIKREALIFFDDEEGEDDGKENT